MANHKSAIKRHRQSLKRAARNRAVKTRVRNTIKAVRTAVQMKDKEQALVLLTTANSVLDKAASRGVIHKKNAARNISRLSKAISGIAE